MLYNYCESLKMLNSWRNAVYKLRLFKRMFRTCHNCTVTTLRPNEALWRIAAGLCSSVVVVLAHSPSLSVSLNHWALFLSQTNILHCNRRARYRFRSCVRDTNKARIQKVEYQSFSPWTCTALCLCGISGWLCQLHWSDRLIGSHSVTSALRFPKRWNKSKSLLDLVWI